MVSVTGVEDELAATTLPDALPNPLIDPFWRLFTTVYSEVFKTDEQRVF
jgi:hypothetical protein